MQGQYNSLQVILRGFQKHYIAGAYHGNGSCKSITHYRVLEVPDSLK